MLDGAKGAYGISVPDLPGCVAMGDTVDEAFTNAIVALRDWIIDARADGERVPPPRSLEEIREDGNVRSELKLGSCLLSIPVAIDTGQPATVRDKP